VRYILPALPLMFLGIGEIAADWEWPRFGRRQVATLLLLLACDPWRVHPEYIAYFNELAGGVDGGRAHLLDSNLDWGQDLHELKHFLEEHPIPSMTLAYFGTMPPEALGIRYTLPRCSSTGLARCQCELCDGPTARCEGRSWRNAASQHRRVRLLRSLRAEASVWRIYRDLSSHRR